MDDRRTYIDELRPKYDITLVSANDTIPDPPRTRIELVEEQCKIIIESIYLKNRSLVEKVLSPDFIEAKRMLKATIGVVATEEYLEELLNQEMIQE